MKPPRTYHAKDRRCFDGAPCPDLQKEISHTRALQRRLRRADPRAHCVHFPAGNCYQVLTGEPVHVTGNSHADLQEALVEAILKLEGLP